MKRLTQACLLACVLALPGCLIVTGQRISTHYDAQRDEMHLLIFYDGIYHTTEQVVYIETQQDGELTEEQAASSKKQAEQEFTEFITQGDVFFLNSLFRINFKEIDEQLAGDELTDARRRLLRAIKKTKRKTIGRYVDFEGRPGIAQQVVIPDCKGLLRAMNAVLNEHLIKTAEEHGNESPENKWGRITTRMWIAAAKRGHAWFRMDGEAFVVDLPFEAQEWQRYRRLLAMYVADKNDTDAELLIAQLASMPVSIVEKMDAVELRLAPMKGHRTARFTTGNEYRDNLAELIRKRVPNSLDDELEEMGSHTMDAPRDVVMDVITWGPPEQAPMAYLAVLEGGPGAGAKRVRVQLDDWAKRWNDAGRTPAAPTGIEDVKGLREAWAEWYHELVAGE